MRRNRKDGAKKERIIMLASSAFVLTALTMTGIYMQSGGQEEDNGYTLDFTALESNAGDKIQEIAQNNTKDKTGNFYPQGGALTPSLGNLEDDLDYTPMEVGSGNIEIPGLTIGKKETEPLKEAEAPAVTGTLKKQEPAEVLAEPEALPEIQDELQQIVPEPGESDVPVDAQPAMMSRELHFSEGSSLLRPLEGEVLIPFSMDGSVYFATLDQYKYNPALMLVAQEGMSVSACAEGHVTNIFHDAQIGNAVTVELGDGYLLTYGQLGDIYVAPDSYVDPGEIIGTVAAPTKYFSVEGANLYLKLEAGGNPVNPEDLFQ